MPVTGGGGSPYDEEPKDEQAPRGRRPPDKPAPAATHEPPKYDVTAAAQRGVNAIRSSTRDYLINQLVKPVERQTILASIDKRASLLNPRLLAANPGLAAELVMGVTKTRDLRAVSDATWDGWRDQQQEMYNAQQAGLARGNHNMLEELRHDNPSGYAVSQGIAQSPELLEFTEKSVGIKDKNLRAFFLDQIAQTATMPEGVGRDYALQGLDVMYDKMLAGNYTIPAEAQEGLGEFTQMAGQAFNIPFFAISKATDLAGRILPDELSNPLDTAQEAVGDVLGAAGTGAQFLQRNMQGAAVLAGEGADFILRGPNGAFFGDDNPEPQGGFLTSDELWTTWDEAESGEHSPFSVALARGLDTTVDDPRYQGAFAAMDMSVDLVGQIGVFKTLAAFKTAIRATTAGGGRFTGEQWINSTVLGGKRFVSVGWDLIKDLPKDQRIAALVGKFKKGMTETMARDLAEATTADEFARLGAEAVDNSGGQSPVVAEKLRAVEAELKIEAETRPAVTPGTETYVHEGNAADLQSYIDNGIRETKGGSAGGAPGVYAFEAERGAQRIVDGLVPEDRIVVEFEADPARLTGTPAEGANVRLVEGSAAPGDIVSIRDAQGNVLYERPGVVSEGSAVRQSALEAERASLQQQAWDLLDHEVVYEFPRVSHVRPFMRGIGLKSWTGRMMNAIFGEGGKVDLSRLANDLTRDSLEMVDPAELNKPKGWASHNADAIRKTMDRVHVPKEVQARIINNMFEVEAGRMASFDWHKQIQAAYREGITRGGKRTISAEADRSVRLSNASVEERTHTPVEETVTLADGSTSTVLRPILSDEFGNPQPFLPTQFMKARHSLPDMQVLADADSSLKYFDRWAKDKPFIGKAYGALRTPVQVAHFGLFELPRLVLRSSFLLFQLPRLALKIEFDQSIRAFLAESVMPYKFWRKSGMDFTEGGIPGKPGVRELLPKDEYGNPDTTALGVAASEALADSATVATKVSTRGLDPSLRPRDATLVADGIARDIAELAADPLARRVALNGPEATLRYLEEHPDSALAVRMRETGSFAQAEKYGGLEAAINGVDAAITRATGGLPELREAMGTRGWKGGEATTGFETQRSLIADELEEARATMATTENPVMRREMNLRIEELEQHDAWLGRQGERQTSDTVSLDDSAALRKRIIDEWQQGSFQVPNEVIVHRRLGKDLPTPGTRLERTRAQAARLNRFIYKGFTPMSKIGLGASRGATYVRVVERVYADLLKNGMEAGRALTEAQARAVFITKDLHYDISARSSLDRKMQNYFWFSPVWREQMMTYLWKVPAKAFWAPGITLEFTMAHTFIQGLKNMGLVTEEVTYTDPETGEEETSPFLHLPGGGMMDVGGLNPLTPATAEVGPPTLSPGAEAVLDFTATHVPKELKPFIQGIDEFFTFDHDITHGPNVIPRSLTIIPEWFGLHIPSETFTNWSEYNKKIDIQTAQLAMSQLAEEGVVPPTAEGASMTEYRTRLAAEVRELERGITGLHVLGRIFLPGTVESDGTELYTNPAALAYYEWKDSLPDAFSKVGEFFYNAQDQYLRAHPEAWPYAVGKHEPAPANAPDDYYTTEAYRNSPLLDDDQYIDKAIQQVAYWSADATDGDPDNVPGDFASLSPRRKARKVAAWSTLPLEDLTDTQAVAVGLPKFDGLAPLLADIGRIKDQYDEQYNSDQSDEAAALIAAHRDYLLQKAAKPYGKEGQRVLEYMHASPAVRLNRGGYFTGPQASVLIGAAQKLRRDVFAKYPEASMAGAAESYGTLQKKADLFLRIDQLRRDNPAFDRQMRYVELGFGDNDEPLGRIAAYQRLFFGEPFYDSDLAGDVLREMG